MAKAHRLNDGSKAVVTHILADGRVLTDEEFGNFKIRYCPENEGVYRDLARILINASRQPS